LAGTIGARAVQTAAAALEQALAHTPTHAIPWAALTDDLELALSRQVQAIQTALATDPHAAGAAASNNPAPLPLPSPGAPPNDAASDAARLATLLSALEHSLLLDDGVAERLAREHEAVLKSAYPQHFHALFRALCAFDSEQALHLLHAAQQSCHQAAPEPAQPPALGSAAPTALASGEEPAP
jgi:hypothetical protein